MADTKRMNRAWLLIYAAGILWAIAQSLFIVKVVPAIWL